MSEVQHQRRRQGPCQPVEDRDHEQFHPCVVHTLRTHDENRLDGIDQPEAEPDQSNPYPALRSHATVVDVHIEIVVYAAARKAKMQPINVAVQ